MGYKNILGNIAFHHSHVDSAAAQDSGDNRGTAVDLANPEARCVVGLVHMGSRAASSSIRVFLEHRETTSATWVAVPGADVTHAGTDGNKYVAVEANTDSVRLRRYVRLVFNRSGGNQQILGTTVLVGNLRVKGSMTMADQVAGKVGQEVTT